MLRAQLTCNLLTISGFIQKKQVSFLNPGNITTDGGYCEGGEEGACENLGRNALPRAGAENGSNPGAGAGNDGFRADFPWTSLGTMRAVGLRGAKRREGDDGNNGTRIWGWRGTVMVVTMLDVRRGWEYGGWRRRGGPHGRRGGGRIRR